MATISRAGWLGATAALLLLGGCADLDRDQGRHGAMHQRMQQQGMKHDGMKHDGMMGQGMMAKPEVPAAGHAHGAEAGTPADQHDHAAGADHGKADGDKMGGKPGMMDKCRQMMAAKRDHKAGGDSGDRSADAKPGDDAPAARKKGDKDGCPMRS